MNRSSRWLDLFLWNFWNLPIISATFVSFVFCLLGDTIYHFLYGYEKQNLGNWSPIGEQISNFFSENWRESQNSGMIRISKPKSATRYKFSNFQQSSSRFCLEKKKKSPRYERYTILVSNSRVVFRIEKRIENNRSNYRNSRISSADCFDKYRNACENFQNSRGIGLNEFYRRCTRIRTKHESIWE